MQCQLAKIYGVTGGSDTIRVEFSPVKQQAGSTDCGLFEIAFATDLAYGEDPVKISYQQCAMREHFAKCLQNEKMVQFPRSKHSPHTSIRRVATIPVYCTCQMPESLDNMVECETCYQWFHYCCVGITGERDTVSWSCQERRGKGKRRWLN